MKKSFSFSKSNLLENFSKNQKINSFKGVFFDNKSYYEKNVSTYYIVSLFGFVCNLATIYSCSFYVKDQLKDFDFEIVVFLSFLFLFLLELFKCFFLNKFFIELLGIQEQKINYFYLSISIIVLSFSMYFTVKGSEIVAVKDNKIEVLKDNFNSLISSVESEIKEINKRNTYKNNCWVVGSDKRLKDLKTKQLESLIFEKEKSLIDQEKKDNDSKKTHRFLFCVFDLMLIACCYYSSFFKRNSLLYDILISDRLDANNDRLDSNNDRLDSNNDRLDSSNDRLDSSNDRLVARIGFKAQSETFNRICLNCTKSFYTIYSKQIYCSDKCRCKSFNKELKINRSQFNIFENE